MNDQIANWLQRQNAPRTCVYTTLRHPVQALELWQKTLDAIGRNLQPPVIEYRGRYWWLTSCEIRGSTAKVRLHEAREVVYVGGVGGGE